MKVAVIHNAYGSAAPSGENTAVQADIELLKEAGVGVSTYFRFNDELYQSSAGAIKAAFTCLWNAAAAREAAVFVTRVKPDVVHVHNTFPILSAAVLWALRRTGVPIVLTVHNYRAACPAGTLCRDGKVCTECIDSRSTFPSVVHGCYRGSRLATIPAAVASAMHSAMKTVERCVDATICLTRYQADTLAKSGLRLPGLHIRPNYIKSRTDPLPWEQRDDRAVFVGRLADYKGIRVLLEAWRLLGDDAPTLEIIGDGPEAALCAEVEAKSSGRIRLSGSIPHAAVLERLRTAKVLLLPSVCPEGCPMAIREAFAAGVPVVASAIGGMAEAVRDGVDGTLIAPGQPDALAYAVRSLFTNQDLLRSQAGQAHAACIRLTSETGAKGLLQVYRFASNQRAKALRWGGLATEAVTGTVSQG